MFSARLEKTLDFLPCALAPHGAVRGALTMLATRVLYPGRVSLLMRFALVSLAAGVIARQERHLIAAVEPFQPHSRAQIDFTLLNTVYYQGVGAYSRVEPLSLSSVGSSVIVH